jgi:hypothetical protein
VLAPVFASWLLGFWSAAGPAVLVLGLLWGILTLVGEFVLARKSPRAGWPDEGGIQRQPAAGCIGGRDATGSSRRGSRACDPFSCDDRGRGLLRATVGTHGRRRPRPSSRGFRLCMAGCAFAVVATVFWLWLSDLDFKPVPAALIFWSWDWPAVLVLGLLLGRDRMRITLVLGVYFGGLLLIGAVGAARGTPALDFFGVSVPAFFLPLIAWAITIKDTPFLLFFLDRRVRSVGPVLLVFMLIVSIGWLLGVVVTSMYAVISAGVFLSRTLSLPTSIFDHLLESLGMVVLALPAWWVIGGIRRAYQAKWLSDQMLVFDAIWLFQALVLCRELSFEVGFSGLVGLAAFVAYKIVTIVGLRPLAVGASRRASARVLLLRVFGFRGRTERLFDLLEARWRYAGPIQMIAAPRSRRENDRSRQVHGLPERPAAPSVHHRAGRPAAPAGRDRLAARCGRAISCQRHLLRQRNLAGCGRAPDVAERPCRDGSAWFLAAEQGLCIRIAGAPRYRPDHPLHSSRRSLDRRAVPPPDARGMRWTDGAGLAQSRQPPSAHSTGSRQLQPSRGRRAAGDRRRRPRPDGDTPHLGGRSAERGGAMRL